jgi:endonuclease III-like uncharacterized protein
MASLLSAQVIKSEKSSSIQLNPKPRNIEVKEIDTIVPLIKIISPGIKENEVFQVFSPELTIVGQAVDQSGVNSVVVNATVMETSDAGVFSIKLPMNPGENEIHVIAFDNKNNFKESRYKVVYTPPVISLADKINKESKYYALIIGIDHYDDPAITDLDNPVRDAQQLARTLVSNYTFDRENVQLIKDAKREDIINALDELSNKSTLNDNLVIFYAGHGWWDQEANIGYWLPSDARKNSKAAWFRNSTLVDYLKEIDCRHTLLITDACFAGAIFKTRSAFEDAPKAIEKLYEMPSRKAMTSGTLTEVPDKSTFVEYLINRLSDNTEKYLSAEQLFSSFRIAVINNSDVVPQFGEIRGVGDEGGDFIFILKE